MSYDSTKFLKLAQELAATHKRQGEIERELAKMFGQGSSQTGSVDPLQRPKTPPKGKPAPPKKAAAKAKAKQTPLQPQVLDVLVASKKPLALFEVVAKLARKRPGTKPAAVASVLYHLVKNGSVQRDPLRDGDLFSAIPPDLQTDWPKVVSGVPGPVETGQTTNVGMPQVAAPAAREEVLEDA